MFFEDSLFISFLHKLDDYCGITDMKECITPMFYELNCTNSIKFLDMLKDNDFIHLIDVDQLYIETHYIELCKAITTIDNVHLDFDHIRDSLDTRNSDIEDSDDEYLYEIETQKLDFLSKFEEVFNSRSESELDEFYKSDEFLSHYCGFS